MGAQGEAAKVAPSTAASAKATTAAAAAGGALKPTKGAGAGDKRKIQSGTPATVVKEELDNGAVNPAAASSAVDASAIKVELHPHPPQGQSLSPIFDPPLPPAANTNSTNTTPNAANHHQHHHHHSHSHYHHSANGGAAQPTVSLPQQQQQQTAIPGPGGQLTPEQIQHVQNLIERCLLNDYDRNETKKLLSEKCFVSERFTELLWTKLEEQNEDFFAAHRLRLKIKEHVLYFNYLVQAQARAESMRGGGRNHDGSGLNHDYNQSAANLQPAIGNVFLPTAIGSPAPVNANAVNDNKNSSNNNNNSNNQNDNDAAQFDNDSRNGPPPFGVVLPQHQQHPTGVQPATVMGNLALFTEEASSNANAMMMDAEAAMENNDNNNANLHLNPTTSANLQLPWNLSVDDLSVELSAHINMNLSSLNMGVSTHCCDADATGLLLTPIPSSASTENLLTMGGGSGSGGENNSNSNRSNKNTSIDAGFD